jgi:hypothetical protein
MGILSIIEKNPGLRRWYTVLGILKAGEIWNSSFSVGEKKK